jgi:hypothetical protein
MYHHPPDEMLLCSHVACFLLAASGHALAKRFYIHHGLHHKCKFGLAGTFAGFDIIRDRAARRLSFSGCSYSDLFIVCLSKNSVASRVVKISPAIILVIIEQDQGAGQVEAALSLCYLNTSCLDCRSKILL